MTTATKLAPSEHLLRVLAHDEHTAHAEFGLICDLALEPLVVLARGKAGSPESSRFACAAALARTGLVQVKAQLADMGVSWVLRELDRDLARHALICCADATYAELCDWLATQ